MRKREILLAQQRMFIQKYVALNCDMSATCRATRVNLQTAQRWFKRPYFIQHLNQRQAILSNAADLTAAEVIGTLASHLRADIADVFPDDPIIKAAKDAGVSHLIRDFEVIETIKRVKGKPDDVLERRTKIKMVDAGKAAQQLAKLMGLESRDDEIERARIAIRTCMAMKGCTAEEAISILMPHFPAVIRLRDEFAGNGPIIEMERLND